uniref:Uncharacterized protein n=1 Tax=Loa loa TaxID=7209 RepID=A0A1I7VPG7_LOALO
MGSTAAGATYQAYNQLIRSPSLHLSYTRPMQQCGIIEQAEIGKSSTWICKLILMN